MKNPIISTEIQRFNYLTNEIDAAYHEAALKLGLSDSAMMILYTVCNTGDECPLNDITHLSGIRKQTVNSALRKMESEDVIYLERFSGRKKKVCLTDKGRTLVKDTVLRVIEIENEIFGSWSDEERKIYIELTQKYLTSFIEKIEKL